MNCGKFGRGSSVLQSKPLGQFAKLTAGRLRALKCVVRGSYPGKHARLANGYIARYYYLYTINKKRLFAGFHSYFA
jgi:hypothetical protein